MDPFSQFNVLKRLDAMLVRGFLPPFLVSFFMALFVLVMQVFWLYVDDILGKGASIAVIFEFLFYLSFSLVPLALPIGVLLAGVFQFGNLGERYELASMKSAGISLFRIMMPLMLLSAAIALFSLVCSEQIIPKSNLKYISRLHDLKRQKPTLGLEEGVFNNDFYGYSIRIAEKSENGKDISGILIYDQSKSPTAKDVSVISAKDGRMYVTPEQRYLVMELFDGFVYQNPERQSARKTEFPFVIIGFEKLTKIFDLSEFELDRTDEELFRGDRKMKNSQQLQTEIDSLALIASTQGEGFLVSNLYKISGTPTPTGAPPPSQIPGFLEKKALEIDSLLTVWRHRDAAYYAKYRLSVLRSVEIEKNRLDSKKSEDKQQYKLIAKINYELQLKKALAFVCFLFIFIGAPLGAIVRKGGYGYPLILCILVFVAYILMNTFCKRLSEGLRIDSTIGAWLPVAILVLPGVFLTWSAMRDRNAIQDLRLLIKSRTARGTLK
ncbi:MAG: LptF/LptG family permease [Saprospiraceae bacterium]|nr:LptF/LptG family permease [Saprospiraceae bacterium]